MFFQKNPDIPQSDCGVITEFPESMVNPLYKPKTLSELKASMVHTGINPAPLGLRSPAVETDGVDAMDSPPVPVFCDNIDAVVIGKAIKESLSDKQEFVKSQMKKPAQSEQTPSE